MCDINPNDRVKIKFGIQANLKDYTGKTNYALGTVEQKVITRHDNCCLGSTPHYSTSYLIKFDSDYYLERSDDDKARYRNRVGLNKYITQLEYTEETKEFCDLYLKPNGIMRIFP